MFHTPRILFLIKKRIQGSSFGLINSSRFVSEVLNAHGLESKVVSVIDNNCIDREVTKYKPNYVIIEALWVVPEKFKILMKLHPEVIWIIRLHSNIGFLATEGIALEWFKDYLDYNNSHLLVAVNNENLAEYLQKIIKRKIIYLPNIYDYGIDGFQTHNKPKSKVVEIGCFGALRQLKNTLFQAVCAIRFADEERKHLNFHINYITDEANDNPINKNLRALFEMSEHTLVEHDWLGHSDFIDLIKEMDLGMQLSFSESFNIVSADFIANGVPILTSDAVEWMPRYYRASTVDYDEVVDKLKFMYRWKNFTMLQTMANEHLVHFDHHSTMKWLDFFSRKLYLK